MKKGFLGIGSWGGIHKASYDNRKILIKLGTLLSIKSLAKKVLRTHLKIHPCQSIVGNSFVNANSYHQGF
jgi:hypothetical protein